MELASCSFGQSSKVSYLQMLTAVCAVVNGGRLMQPYLVQRITAPDGTVVKETEPTVKRQVISAETSATMCKLMEGVVTGGTGTRAAVPGYRVGGKSGTSQKLDSKNEGARIASFVAVAKNDGVNISARSMGALNVQVILEPLGGGGHLMMAGAQLQNCTLQDAEHRIREQIDLYRAAQKENTAR